MNPGEEEQVFPEGEPSSDTVLGSAKWAALNPTRKQVVEVWMPSTNRENAPETWASFLVMSAGVSPEKDVVLEVKSLGSLSAELDKEHSLMFNRKKGFLHLCSAKPCMASEEYSLHATRVRVYNLEGYAAFWYNSATRRQVEKWLDPGAEPTPREGQGDASRVKKRPSVKESGDKGKKDKGPKKGRAPARGKPAGAVPEAVVADLRGKLKGLRARIRGKERAQPPPSEEGRKSESIEVHSSEDEASLPALGNGLQTGMDLRQGPWEKKDKKKKPKEERKRRSKKRCLEDSALVATSGSTSRNLQGQLASSAVAALKESRGGQKKRKRRSSAEKVGDALAKALAPLGLGKVKKERKASSSKRKKKRKKRKGGDPSSSGETSYSEESSSSGSEEEEGSESSKEMEAPMVKRSREKPGSVLELLVQHARAQLDQSSAVSLPSESCRVDQGVKILSYFQVILKPQLGATSGPVREMFLIATVLDLLRKGHLSQVGDSLAARFFALHQSQLDGHWQAAKHLEIHSLDEATSTTTAVLLQTRRHARIAAKAQGLEYPSGSWGAGWNRKGKGGKGRWHDGEWKGAPHKGGKGKEKGKKGKSSQGKGATEKAADWSQKEPPGEK